VRGNYQNSQLCNWLAQHARDGWGLGGRPGGRFLIRLSDSLLLAPQSDLGKKTKRCSKGLGEKRPDLGCFCFTAVGGSFFWRRKNFRVASLGSEWQKTAHMKLILCVLNRMFYCSGYTAPEM
jgi:hypothetical protein